MPCESQSFRCEQAYLGQFILNASQVARMKKVRDYRPTDEERDEILEKTPAWLREHGFAPLTYKTQYFETTPLADGNTEFAPGIGTARISWVYTPCLRMTVTAQQMQQLPEESQIGGRDDFTFRQWNPYKVDATMGSDNSGSPQQVCPVFFIGWYAIERLLFFNEFDGCVDYCKQGNTDLEEVVAEYDRATNITLKTTIYRVYIFLQNAAAFYMVLTGVGADEMPRLLFVEYMVSAYPSTAYIWSGLLMSLTVQLLLSGLVWLLYAPCFATSLLLTGTILASGFAFIGR